MKGHELVVSDLYLASFLKAFGFPPTLSARNGRIVFVFPRNDEFYKLSAAFNTNGSVPISDFVSALKILKSQMYQARLLQNVDVTKSHSITKEIVTENGE